MEVLVSVRVEAGSVVTTILLDRPQKAHAYDSQTLNELESAFSAVDTGIVVLSSTGSGAFCGGADLDEMKGASVTDALEMRSQGVFEQLATAPWLSLAAVQGAAVGGGFELALACDLRVAGPQARFVLPETALGLVPSAGGCTRLPRVVGPGRAKEVILGGRELDAETALSWGVIARIAEDPLEEALGWARSIAERDLVALRLAKTILDAGDSRENTLQMERLAEALLYARKNGG